MVDWLDGTTSKKLPHELMSSMSRDLDPAQYDDDEYWDDGEPDYVSLENTESIKVRTTDAVWRSARVLVSESFFKWHSFMFPVLFC